MPQIVLYADASTAEGVLFTAAALDRDAARRLEAIPDAPFGDEELSGDVVARSALDAARVHYRSVGYRRDGAAPEPRAASEWWDVRAVLDADGGVAWISRDTLTGALVVDDSLLAPTGSLTGMARFQGYTPDGSALAPLFSVQGGLWEASVLRAADGAALHALLTAGNDGLVGTEFADQIEAGAGVDELTGLGGADQFLVARGAGARWVKGERSDRGVLVNTRLRRRGGKEKRYSAYDPDVDVVVDFQKGVDSLHVQGSSSRYALEDNGESTLVFAGTSRRNLVAVIVGVRGLDQADLLPWP